MKTTTFLTFVGSQCGKGTEAIDFYTRVFPKSEVKLLIHYKPGEAGGTPELIKYGLFTLNGADFMLAESNYQHAWSFTPAVSILIEDHSDDVLPTLFQQLSTDGQVLMPLDDYQGEGDYGFGKKFGWCEDKYGVSWQFLLT